MSDPDFARPGWPRTVLAGLLIWIVLSLAVATRPLVDHVPTGMVDGEETSEAVTCHSALSGSGESAEPLPALEPPRAYGRRACETMHSQARLVLWLDVVVALAGAAFLVRKIARDRPRTIEAARTPASAV